MTPSFVLSADQMRTLATLATRGNATVCTLGLPTQASPVVVHQERGSSVLEVDGRVIARDEEAAA